MENTTQILASKKAWAKSERKRTADAIRYVRHCLISKDDLHPSEYILLLNAIWVVGGILICGLIIASCKLAPVGGF